MSCKRLIQQCCPRRIVRRHFHLPLCGPSSSSGIQSRHNSSIALVIRRTMASNGSEQKLQDVAVPDVSKLSVEESKHDPSVDPTGKRSGNAKPSTPSKPNKVITEYPDYIKHRLTNAQVIREKYEAQIESKRSESSSIQITLPDGKQIEGQAFQTSPMDVAKQLSNSLAKKVLIARINDTQLWDLTRPLESDCKLELLDYEGGGAVAHNVFWHSSAHILGQAIEMEFAQYEPKLCIGPPLEDGGFYYDVFFKQPYTIGQKDYELIEKRCNAIIKEKQTYTRLVLEKQEALNMFQDNHFKQEIINNKVPDGETCTAYVSGPLIDLCRGPHIPSTGVVAQVHIFNHGSAYWLGKVENPSLQRIYGISFPDKKQLAEWKDIRRKAMENDHRKVGLQQKLFFFHEYSPGSAFFLPHGARIYNTLMNFIRDQYWKRGYTEVMSPNVYSTKLWETSGHYANYKENMFLFEVEKQEYGVKPMNCPGHCLMFANSLKSYRDLPLRYADFGVLHRNELSGALSGLTRVRRFQQDDAHIFCTTAQIEQEVSGVLDMLKEVYAIFGFKFELHLSTRPEKFLGEIEVWDRAEKALSDTLDKHFPKQWELNPGDGAFYGPKIDIKLFDALKRKHQCATIQLDFQLPERFKLEFKALNEGYERPVMIHRAILGSVERMIAVLIEHTGGKWPFWLSPRQAIVVPIGATYYDYADKIQKQLHDAGFFVDADLGNNSFNKKVREAQLQQYNYILIVGEKEQEAASVNVRHRDDPTKQELKSVDELSQWFADLKKNHQ